MKIESLRFQVGLIALMQALLLTNNVTLIAINGLAGAKLASDPTFATLPVTGYVLGAALSSMAASRLMRLRGRRAGYTVGALFAIVGTLLVVLKGLSGSSSNTGDMNKFCALSQ